jgi:pimeloyl-ACP methyl ester carboxylesterase
MAPIATPPVLLVPGGAEAVHGFFPGMPEALAEDPGCRVVEFDRPGAEGSTEDGSLADAADAIHAEIPRLGCAPVVVVAQSLGGAVAVLLAAAHPEDVVGLVLLDPSPINDTELATALERRMASTERLGRVPVVRSLLHALLRGSASRSARRHGMEPARRAAALQMADADLGRLARAVDGIASVAARLDLSDAPAVPTVVVSADRPEDDAVRRAHERLARAFGGTVAIWPGAEHMVHLTHPEQVLGVCREVIARASGL